MAKQNRADRSKMWVCEVSYRNDTVINSVENELNGQSKMGID